MKSLLKQRLLLPILAGALLFGCKKSNLPEEQQPLSNQLKGAKAAAVAQFNPPVKVSYGNNMLQLDSYNDLLQLLDTISNSDPAAVKLWEKSLGFESQRTVFNDVVAAEEAVTAYYESLPPDQQDYWLKQPEQHSDVYNQSIREGILSKVQDPEGNYDDLALGDPAMAPVVGRNGLIRVEGKIYQYTNTTTKVILDGDVKKIPWLDKYNTNYNNTNGDSIYVGVIQRAGTIAKASLYTDYSQYSGWRYDGSRKRFKAWVEFRSYPYGKPYYSDCTAFMTAVSQIRTQAQKKNFWGNWKFSGFYPALTVYNSWWSYQYDRFYDGWCGLKWRTQSNDLSYSSNPHPSYSPINYRYYGGTNNGFFTLVPHGTWYAWASIGYFRSGFRWKYSFYLNYGGQPFNYFY